MRHTLTPATAVDYCDGSWLTRSTGARHVECTDEAGRIIATIHGDSWAMCHKHYAEYVRATVNKQCPPIADTLLAERHPDRYEWLNRHGYTTINDEAIVLAQYLRLARHNQPGHTDNCTASCCILPLEG